MTGYSGFSKSNNAIDAEGEGRFPLSEAARRAKVPAALIGEHVQSSEWHHTSGWYNRTNYYDVEDIRAIFGLAPPTEYGAEPIPAAVAALAAWKPEKKSVTVHEGCTVEWLEWSGSRNHPRAETRRAENIRITVSGKSATLHLAGGTTVRKMLYARGLEIRLADGRLL